MFKLVTYFIRLGIIPMSLFCASSSLTRQALQHPMCPLNIVSVTYRMSPFLKCSSSFEFGVRSKRVSKINKKISPKIERAILPISSINVSYENLSVNENTVLWSERGLTNKHEGK